MSKKVFRPIHYLGSKLRILEFISEVINEVDPSGGTVCDLFSGSGSVSRYLAYERKVVSVDIQEYSTVISDSILNPKKISNINDLLQDITNSKELTNLLYIFEPLVKYEEKCIKESLNGKSEKLCEFLEKGSFIKYRKEQSYSFSKELLNSLQLSEKRIIEKDNLKSNTLISQYFGGIYFSYEQSIYLDAILNYIVKKDKKLKDTLLAALLSTSSDIVNTVGNQFAQPIQPRNKNGAPKNNLAKRLLKDRAKDTMKIYEDWLNKYSDLVENNAESHIVIKDDYLSALDNLENEKISVVYADPPYTRDHYSRFYHVLETICLNDYPEISTNKVNGNLELSRALYRKERHQSPFCIKTQAPIAFENMFKKVSEMKASLVLSYSPFDEKGNERPRVMTIDKIKAIGSKYFSNIYEKCPGKIQHSKLNNKEKNFEIKTHGEILIVFTL